MKLENKIRAVAKRKTIVTVTRRARSKKGFAVVSPSGVTTHFTNKKTALANLQAQIRCQDVQRWLLAAL